MVCGTLLTIGGSWLREMILINENFNFIFPGTIIVAFAQVFYVNNSSKLATMWFGDNEVSKKLNLLIYFIPESSRYDPWWFGNPLRCYFWLWYACILRLR